MCCDPLKPEPVANSPPRPARVKEILRTKSWRNFKRNELAAKKSPSSDTESHDLAPGSGLDSSLDLNHYRIVNELWHFMSVDWGHRCM
jgi:hypothetical protein